MRGITSNDDTLTEESVCELTNSDNEMMMHDTSSKTGNYIDASPNSLHAQKVTADMKTRQSKDSKSFDALIEQKDNTPSEKNILINNQYEAEELIILDNNYDNDTARPLSDKPDGTSSTLLETGDHFTLMDSQSRARPPNENFRNYYSAEDLSSDDDLQDDRMSSSAATPGSPYSDPETPSCSNCFLFRSLPLRVKMRYYAFFFFFCIFLGIFFLFWIFLKVKWEGKLNGEPNAEVIDDLNIMILFFSLLSCFGSIYIFASIMFHKTMWKNLHMHFIASLAFSDIFFAFKLILSSSLSLAGINEINDNFVLASTNTNGSFPHGLCLLSAILGQFFGLATVSWNAVIGFAMWQSMKDPIQFRENSRSYKCNAHVFVWSMSSITCIIPIIAQALGDPAIGYTSDGTCWLNQGYVFLFYVPLYAYFFACLYFLGAVYTSMKNYSRAFTRSVRRNAGFADTVVYRVTCFTFAFISVWLWGVIIRIWDNVRLELGYPVLSPFESDEIHFVFTQAFFLAFGGLLNSLIWVQSIVKIRSTVRKNRKRAGSWVNSFFRKQSL